MNNSERGVNLTGRTLAGTMSACGRLHTFIRAADFQTKVRLSKLMKRGEGENHRAAQETRAGGGPARALFISQKKRRLTTNVVGKKNRVHGEEKGKLSDERTKRKRGVGPDPPWNRDGEEGSKETSRGSIHFLKKEVLTTGKEEEGGPKGFHSVPESVCKKPQ